MNSYDSQAASSPVVRCDVKNCQYHEKDGSCSAGKTGGVPAGVNRARA